MFPATSEDFCIPVADWLDSNCVLRITFDELLMDCLKFDYLAGFCNNYRNAV